MNRFYTFFYALTIITGLLTGGCVATEEVKKVKKQILVYPSPPDEPRFFFEKSLVSSADVVQVDEESVWKQALTGETRSGEGLYKPFGIAAYKGRVYVSDSQIRAVAVFDFAKKQFSKIGEEDPGALIKPLGIDVDSKGNLYVCDASAKKIMIYDPTGKYIKSVGTKEQFARPSSVTTNADGSRIYVVDTGGVSSKQHKILVFDGNSGKHLFDIGKRGSKDGELNLPRDAVIGPDGLLYVVDGGNFRLQVFNPEDGTFVRSIGGVGRRGGQFARPKMIDVDAAGNLYVSDAAFGNFQIFNAKGQLLLAIGSRSGAGGPAKYMLPAGIEVDEDGRVLMVDQYFHKIDVYRPAKVASGEGYIKFKKAVAP